MCALPGFELIPPLLEALDGAMLDALSLSGALPASGWEASGAESEADAAEETESGAGALLEDASGAPGTDSGTDSGIDSGALAGSTELDTALGAEDASLLEETAGTEEDPLCGAEGFSRTERTTSTIR